MEGISKSNNFDLLRLFAASQVVISHTGEHLQILPPDALVHFLALFPGVPIFFVISGFLVTDSFLRADSLMGFFRNRALRIYPALWANLLVLEFVMFLAGQNGAMTKPLQYLEALLFFLPTASQAIAYVFTRPDFLHYPNGFLPFYPSGVLWTLTIELSFYVVLPLIATTLLKGGRVGTVAVSALFVLSFSLAATFWTREFAAKHYILDVLFPAYLWMFGIGIFARFFWDQLSALFLGKALLWAPLYVASGLYGNYTGWLPLKINFHYEVGFVPLFRMLFLSGTIFSLAYTFRRASAWLHHNDISYGVYLWHMLFVTILMAFGLKGNYLMWFVVIGCTIATASLSWLVIEKPALRWKVKARRQELSPSANTPLASTPAL